MSLCDCGKLATPTLEQLLAVARNMPLPRIRERRPSPARVGASLKGWLEWRLVNRQGREVAGGEGPNLITDQGLDQVATQLILEAITPSGGGTVPIIQYAAVGTGSSSPDVSDTALDSELARTNNAFQSPGLARTSPGVYEITIYIEFDYGVANGVLAEWGFSFSSSSGGNLFNRALFTDSGGSPDAITKTDQEKLRLTYTLEISLSPVSMTVGSFAVTNVGTVEGQYTLLGAADPASISSPAGRAADLQMFSALARAAISAGTTVLGMGQFLATDQELASADYGSATSISQGSPRIATGTVTARDAYSPGSFTRTGGAWRFETSDAPYDPIKAFAIGGTSDTLSGNAFRPGYVFSVDEADRFSKDLEHVLVIGVPTVTWGRT